MAKRGVFLKFLKQKCYQINDFFRTKELYMRVTCSVRRQSRKCSGCVHYENGICNFFSFSRILCSYFGEKSHLISSEESTSKQARSFGTVLKVTLPSFCVIFIFYHQDFLLRNKISLGLYGIQHDFFFKKGPCFQHV